MGKGITTAETFMVLDLAKHIRKSHLNFILKVSLRVYVIRI